LPEADFPPGSPRFKTGGHYIVKKIVIAASAIALIASGITVAPANAAAVSASRATVGAQCAVNNAVAKGKGADGSDLVCRVATIGTGKGIRQWLYAEDPILASLDMLITSGPGGFDTFGASINSALKAEGLVTAEPTKRNLPGAGQTVGLTSFYNNDTGQANKAVIVGFASVGGVHVNKGAHKVSDLVPAVSLMRDPVAIAVRKNSKYKTMADLVADMKKTTGKKLAIAGGSLGTVDHFAIASIYEALGVPKRMNYIPYAGGGGVAAGILSDATFAAAVSGYDEFAPQIAAGTLRVLGVSFDTRIPGIKAKTFQEQGVPVVVSNWRGIALPKGTSKANRDKFIRAISVMRASNSWKAIQTARNYQDFWQVGDRFRSYVKGQERTISAAFKKLGL
jgi:putative tricarboxylic transport membrane protein